MTSQFRGKGGGLIRDKPLQKTILDTSVKTILHWAISALNESCLQITHCKVCSTWHNVCMIYRAPHSWYPRGNCYSILINC